MPGIGAVRGFLHGAADLANQLRFPGSIHNAAVHAGEGLAAKNLGRHGQEMLNAAQRPVAAAGRQVEKATKNLERYNTDRAADLARIRSERAINKTKLNMAHASGDANAIAKANQEIAGQSMQNQKIMDIRRQNAHQARNNYQNAVAAHGTAQETYNTTMRPLLDQQQRSFQQGYSQHVAAHRYHNLKVIGGVGAAGVAGVAGFNAMRQPQRQQQY